MELLPGTTPKSSAPLRLALFYALVASLWIAASDWLLYTFIPNPALLVQWQTYKGWGFVVASAVLLYVTARREVKQLVASEHRYRTLVDLSPDSVWITQNNRIVFVNAACLRLVGADRPEQVLGKTPYDLIHPDYHALVRQRLQTMLDQAVSVPPIEEKIVRLDGTLVEVEVAAAPLRYNQAQAVQVIHRDLTERKRAEAAVARERDFSQNALDSVPGILYLYDAEGHFLRWNRNFETISGYNADEIAHMHPLDFFEGAEKNYLAQQIQAVFVEGEGTAEANFVAKSGRLIPYYFTGRRIDLDGAPGLIGMGIDITERKRAEEAVRVSQQRLQATLDLMLEGCQLIGFDWRYLYVNDALVAQGRRTRAELLGHTMLEAYPGLDQTPLFKVLRHCMETRTHRRLEYEFEFSEGDRRWFDLSIQPVEEGLFILSHDITERKQTEAEILQLNADLERRVLERTAELAGANAQLTAKNDELKGFAYTVSHDLKAPLRGIAGYAQELERRHSAGLSQRATFCLTQILTATRNLERLIDDLLQYARLDAEVPSLAQVEIAALVQSLLRDRSQVIAERGVQVAVESSVTSLRAWPRGLMQVLANLIDNALKYSRGAPVPQLSITIAAVPAGCRFTVRDNGIGFDMKYHDRIFGLFNRLVRPEEFEGTGAGLAIVKKLVDKMGGRLWAEAAVGAGAAFFVELPHAPQE